MKNGKPGYSLAMIVRNCASNLERVLASFGKYPDELVIVNTGVTESEEGFQETNEVAKKYGAKIFHFPWVDDFAAARNFSFAQCSYEYVAWLDSDDTVSDPGKMDAGFRRAMEDNYDWVIAQYLYEWDGEPLNSNCTTSLLRERLVRKPCFEWKAPLHECLIAKFSVRGTRIDSNMAVVVHHQRTQSQDELKAKLARNVQVLEKNFPDGKCETRMLFYWGNTLLGMKRWKDALEKYKAYIAVSDNVPERIVALNNMSEAYRLLKDYESSKRAAQEAMLHNPQLPTAWLMLAESSMMNQDYARAVVYAQECIQRQRFLVDEMVCNPYAVQSRPTFVLAIGFAGLRRLGDAKQWAERAKEFYPEDEEILSVLKTVSDMEVHDTMIRSFQNITEALKSENRLAEAEKVAAHAPRLIALEHTVHRLLPKSRPEGKPSIAFYCPGGQPKPWGPDSIKEGIGGSEEATINLAMEFARKGWHVEVYTQFASKIWTDPVTGVVWYPTSCWTGRRDRPLDVAIWWRWAGSKAEVGSSAKQNYLWLHDVVPQGTWAYKGWEEYDKVFVLSQFHREVVDCIPDEYIVRIENGLDPDLIVPEAELTNEPHRIIWGSDPSRGLQFLLPWWKYIRQKVADAEIDIFYGWSDLYIEKMEDADKRGPNDFRQVYDRVEDLRKQPGVNWHGKVGQDVLARAFAKSGVWVYPTMWPEVYCITAIKAQAHGVIPICRAEFAMLDTVKYGIPIPKEKDPRDPVSQKWVADQTIDLMLHPEKFIPEYRKEMIAWARQKTWKAVADQWEGLFQAKVSVPA